MFFGPGFCFVFGGFPSDFSVPRQVLIAWHFGVFFPNTLKRAKRVGLGCCFFVHVLHALFCYVCTLFLFFCIALFFLGSDYGNGGNGKNKTNKRLRVFVAKLECFRYLSDLYFGSLRKPKDKVFGFVKCVFKLMDGWDRDAQQAEDAGQGELTGLQ